MDSCILNKKGISIMEVIVILLIIVLMLSMVVPNYVGRINNANYEKTVNELTAIAQASIDYFILEESWPIEINQLAPEFMPYAVTSSPFGTNYQITCVNNMVTVSVLIPAGIAQKNPQGQLLVINNQGSQDQIGISKTVQNEFTSRLNYDLKYVY
jgi:type II secretory pathway pseudopilin PulG